MQRQNILFVIVATFCVHCWAQTVLQTDFEETTCATPYRFTLATSRCLTGRTATRCDTRAYVNRCYDCNGAGCTIDRNGALVNTCEGSSKLSCEVPTPEQAPKNYVTYVEYKYRTCGVTLPDTAVTFNQTKFDCANGFDSISCLPDGTGVLYTKWVGGTRCTRVEFTKTFKFGECAEVIQGTRWRMFTGCVKSGANAALTMANVAPLMIVISLISFIL
jgi:hypothetical protein